MSLRLSFHRRKRQTFDRQSVTSYDKGLTCISSPKGVIVKSFQPQSRIFVSPRFVTAGLALLVALAMVQPLTAQRKTKPGATSDSIKIPYATYKLPNGLNVILSLDRAAPTVAVDIWYP